jgi:hypothetical protein
MFFGSKFYDGIRSDIGDMKFKEISVEILAKFRRKAADTILLKQITASFCDPPGTIFIFFFVV